MHVILLFIILLSLLYINPPPAKYNVSDRGPPPMNEMKMKPILKLLLLFLMAGTVFMFILPAAAESAVSAVQAETARPSVNGKLHVQGQVLADFPVHPSGSGCDRSSGQSYTAGSGGDRFRRIPGHV